MYTIIYIAFDIFSLFVLVYAVKLLSPFVGKELKSIRNKIAFSYRNRFDTSLRSDYEKYFLGKFAYFDKLPEHLKLKFLHRVKTFIGNKTFEGRGGIVVTDEMKAMVAGASVQLTFGLEAFLLDHFSKIIIYPDSYYSTITGYKHKGEANPAGILVLSWKDLVKGYEIPHDTYNVGLHEMAHALELEKRLGGQYDFYFSSYYEKWKRITEDEFQNVQDDGDSYFRSYAGTNRHEFFAVCIEHFFEESEEFKANLPQIYYHLCILLNQDPLSKDTLVNSVKHKSNSEIYKEVTSSRVLFSTNYTLSELNLRPLITLAFIAFLYINNKTIGSKIILGSVFAAMLYAFPSFFLFKRIILYEKYLAVSNFSKKIIAIYPLEDIVSIRFITAARGSSIEILMVREGKIYKNSHSYLSGASDNESLMNLLDYRDVIVKG